MGQLTLPPSGLVYLDANCAIYSVEKHPKYWPLLVPVWQAAKAKTVEIVSSDLILLETLVGPLKSGDAALATAYETLFLQPQTRLFPITHSILREAAQLRATTNLKTPDAIHAATACESACALIVSNDPALRVVAGRVPVTILSDLLP